MTDPFLVPTKELSKLERPTTTTTKKQLDEVSRTNTLADMARMERFNNSKSMIKASEGELMLRCIEERRD